MGASGLVVGDAPVMIRALAASTFQHDGRDPVARRCIIGIAGIPRAGRRSGFHHGEHDKLEIFMEAEPYVSLHALSASKSLWISLLGPLRHVQPMPFASQKDLFQCDCPTLSKISSHLVRLGRNWSRPFPQIAGRVRADVIPGGHHAQIIAYIPTTGLILIHSIEQETAVCWDSTTASVVGALHIGSNIWAVSTPYEEHGKYRIGLVTDGPEGQLYESIVRVLDIEHGPTTKPRLSQPHFYTAKPGHLARHVFVFRDIFGFVEMAPSGETPVVAINTSTGVAVQLPSQEFHGIWRCGCFAHEDHLYLLNETPASLQVTHFSRDELRGDGTPAAKPAREIPLALDPSTSSDYEPVCVTEGRPSYGIGAISIRLYPDGTGSSNNTVVRFWPCSTTGQAGAPLRIEESATLELQGSVRKFDRFFVSPWHSVRRLPLLLEFGDPPQLKLRMAHYDGESVSVCDLVLPPAVDLRAIASILLDEHRGILFLMDFSGLLIQVPYA